MCGRENLSAYTYKFNRILCLECFQIDLALRKALVELIEDVPEEPPLEEFALEIDLRDLEEIWAMPFQWAVDQ